MDRRRGLWLIAGVFALALSGTFAVTRPGAVPQDRLVRPAGPSAVEEAGEKPKMPISTQAAPRQINRPSPTQRTRRAERAPMKRMTDVPRHQEETREKPGSGTATTGTQNHSADSQVSGERGRSFSPPETTTPPAGDGNVSAPTVTAVPSPPPQVQPVLTPPVLLTAPSHADGSGGYQLILERGDLAPRLRAQALEGRVVLRILVLANGSVDRAEIAQSSGQSALDQAAVTVAWSWQFDPATRDGIPIDAWVLIPVRFVVR
jgi:TonB family protein